MLCKVSDVDELNGFTANRIKLSLAATYMKMWALR